MPPSLPIAGAVRSAVFRRATEYLSSDPEIRRVVDTFAAWCGRVDDGVPPGRAQLPWLRATMLPGRTARATNDAQAIPIRVRLDVVVDGEAADDAANLLELAEDVILSAGFREAIEAAGASWVEPAEDPADPLRLMIPEGASSASTLYDVMIYREG